MDPIQDNEFPLPIDELAILSVDIDDVTQKIQMREERRKEYSDQFYNSNLKFMAQEEKDKLFKTISVQKRKRNKAKYKKRRRMKHEEMLKTSDLSVKEKIERNMAYAKERDAKIEKGRTEGLRIAFDLSYDYCMSAKEVKSLGFQLCYVYNVVKQTNNLLSLNLCGVKGMLKEELEKFGSQYWIVNMAENPIEEVFAGQMKDIIYLSPDAEEDLHEFSQDKIYVIGGLVDKTILKDESKNRAQALNVESRRLPFGLLKNMNNYRKSLNINTMVQIIDSYLTHKDMTKALESTLSTKYFDKGKDFSQASAQQNVIKE